MDGSSIRSLSRDSKYVRETGITLICRDQVRFMAGMLALLLAAWVLHLHSLLQTSVQRLECCKTTLSQDAVHSLCCN